MTRKEWKALLRERFDMAPGDSPCSWPVSRIRHTIARTFPQFRRSKLRVLRRGHNLVVEADRGTIFKFPWHPQADFKREIRTLRSIAGRLNIATPVPVFIGPESRFFGYRKIDGLPPRWNQFLPWTLARRRTLAAELARLAESVQRAIAPRDRLALMGSRPDMRKETVEVADVDRQFRRLFVGSPWLVKTGRRVFADYIQRCRALTPSRLNHVAFDLQFDNLLVDRRGRLTGIVDLGYLTWSDASGIFGLVYKDDPGLARMAAAAFTRKTGTPMSIAQARVQGLYQVFSYLVEVSTNRWDLSERRREWLRIAGRFRRS